MDTFLSWLVTALKFGAIFISGFAGIMSLLTEFKDKQGKITRAGRIALYTVVISFFISAVMQIIDIHQDNKRAAAKAEETSQILENINRQLYKIDEKEISFEVSSELALNDAIFTGYANRLQAFCKAHKTKRPEKEVKGVNFSYLNHRGPLNGLEIESGSPLYPDPIKEKKAFSIIGQLMLDIKIYRTNPASGKQSDTASLSFSTEQVQPKLWYTPGDNTISMSVGGLKIREGDFSWRNQGDIQSLADLKRAKVTFTYSDAYFDSPPNDNTDVPKKIQIKSFSMTIASRMFTSGQFCSLKQSIYTEYYFLLPEDILKTHHNITCP